ncbi:TetR/AcrR family transcriptional regulator [Exiguobacterium undae]|uniref:TetR family transcriptional regulator n=1 Tax=Exiguobacterium undae TaxID=169177 RepID=A0ABX2V6B6_9BACL|nr:TetR/AcrR family transcriptional regulator [Exiguobacterium undae]OAN10265.1 TetR family transcriptional regulator [Exiguobacterium undae]
MTKQDNDLRVIRTKQLIKEALIGLIEEKGFENITVKDIAKQAGINRGTFYSHYEDKYDLMNLYIEEIFTGAEEKLIKNLQVLFKKESQFPPADASLLLVPFLEFLYQNRVLMKTLLGPNGDLQFQDRLKKFMHDALFHRSSESLFDKNKLLVPSEYLISYISSAHIGVVQEWLLHEKGETPEEIAKIIFTITTRGPLHAGGLL